MDMGAFLIYLELMGLPMVYKMGMKHYYFGEVLKHYDT